MVVNRKITMLFVFCLTSMILSQDEVTSERQILINPDFSLPLVQGFPPGWFKARIPAQADNLDMYQAHDEKGSYLVLQQKRFAKNMFNNWAQRIESPPVGKTLRLETMVATENMQGKGAAVLLMFFREDGRILRAVSSEQQQPLVGDTAWTSITLETDVPAGAHLGMVRLGISEGPGTLKIRHAHLYLRDGEVTSPPRPGQAGLELLVNGDFEGDAVSGVPVGWFKAMLPKRAINMQAGIDNDPNRGQVVFLQQEGVKARLINNWAQRLETIPRGARLRLAAEVKTEDVPENTGFVMIQCWGPDDKLLAAATSQSRQPIGGTADWRFVDNEVDVPMETQTIIVRCGLSQSGKIWFDNVSLMVISTDVDPLKHESQGKAPARRAGAFRVTDQSVEQLKRLQTVANELATLCADRLGPETQVRQEIFAQADGRYEVVIFVDMGRPN